MVGFTLADEQEFDRHSVHSIASTVGTTTSLASRIRDINLDFGDKLREHTEQEEEEEAAEDRSVSRQEPSQVPEGDPAGRSSEDNTVSLPHAAEDDLMQSHSLHLLHRDPPLQPLQVCCRLFERRSHPPLPLKRMSMAQVEDFRQHGYVVMDGLLTREAAARIKSEAARLALKGLLQPVSQAHLGIMSSQNSSTAPAVNGTCNGCASSSSNSSQGSLPSSSQAHSPSSCGPPPGFANGSTPTNSRTASAPQQQRQQHSPQGQQQPPPQQQQQRWGELRLPMQLGHPPADTAVFAPLMAALQELQEDLSEFVRLRSKGSAEYCLCQLPTGSLPVPRHKDALPDDGRHEGSTTPSAGQAAAAAAAVPGSSPPQQQHPAQFKQPQPQQQQQQQRDGMQSPTAAAAAAAAAHLGPAARRVSMFVFLNPDWDKEGGGVVRLWPPMRPTGPPSTAAASAARRSPTSSDAGTTFSEVSDCGSSLRVAFLGSTTSSVIAEASAPDHDTYSLDGISVAESEAERQGFEWVECDGGEMALDIAPLAGRVLLVLSGAVEHALLPGHGSSPACDTVFMRAWCC